MEDKPHTIGLTDLLSEVDRDLEELRKKHPADYGMKNLGMWWELERERLLVRHGPATPVQQLRRARGVRRTLVLFTAGWLAMIVIQAALRLVLP
jgi:hypothetical protein